MFPFSFIYFLCWCGWGCIYIFLLWRGCIYILFVVGGGGLYFRFFVVEGGCNILGIHVHANRHHAFILESC